MQYHYISKLIDLLTAVQKTFLATIEHMSAKAYSTPQALTLKRLIPPPKSKIVISQKISPLTHPETDFS